MKKRVKLVINCVHISISFFCASPAMAVVFNFGSWDAQLDSELAIGAGWSTQSANKNLIGRASGGKGVTSLSDNGRLNFKQGETFSKRVEGKEVLSLKHADTGIVLGAHYWYDFELKDEDRSAFDIQDQMVPESAKSSGFEWLDAFVFQHYVFMDRPGTVRLGNQRINWGEGLFIQNGINIINSIDVRDFRSPGIEIKDALVPTNLLYDTQTLTDDWTLDGFYQLDWDKTALDNCGTFFSESDIVTTGCNNNFIIQPSNFNPIMLDRRSDETPSNGGQFGLATHYQPGISTTDIGLYFMNYHSRLPLIGGGYSSQDLSNKFGRSTDPYYRVTYPEDIKLYGASFSQLLPYEGEWRGEISYRPNDPIQINGIDLLSKEVTSSSSNDESGYNRKKVTQLQTSFTQPIKNVMHASKMTLTGEVGFVHVGDLDDSSTLYGRSSVFGAGINAGLNCQKINGSSHYCENDGYTTNNSWGYRFKMAWDYLSVLPGLDLYPSTSFAHDVKGYSPQPDSSFVEGRKSISLALNSTYKQLYQFKISYTNFFGGKYNLERDRDFLELEAALRF